MCRLARGDQADLLAVDIVQTRFFTMREGRPSIGDRLDLKLLLFSRQLQGRFRHEAFDLGSRLARRGPSPIGGALELLVRRRKKSMNWRTSS